LSDTLQLGELAGELVDDDEAVRHRLMNLGPVRRPGTACKSISRL
jgi:hypothetical protein